jgi:hypothetical protein
MKRLALLILAVFMAITLLAGCATSGSSSDPTAAPTSSNDPTPAPTTSNDPTPKPTTNNDPTPKPTTINEVTPTPTPRPSDKAAFTGTTDEILNQLISKTIGKKILADEELKSIKCYKKKVDADSCQDILGLKPDEFAVDVETAIESKPDGSWFAHSIVLIKGKNGVDVAALAKIIAKGTNPERFGCIKAEAVVVGYAGQYIVLCASFKTTSDAVYSTFSELSAVKANRIDRENDWSGSGPLG